MWVRSQSPSSIEMRLSESIMIDPRNKGRTYVAWLADCAKVADLSATVTRHLDGLDMKRPNCVNPRINLTTEMGDYQGLPHKSKRAAHGPNDPLAPSRCQRLLFVGRRPKADLPLPAPSRSLGLNESGAPLTRIWPRHPPQYPTILVLGPSLRFRPGWQSDHPCSRRWKAQC